MVKKNSRMVKDLSEHEKEELEKDFNIDIENKYILMVLTKEQYDAICKAVLKGFFK